MTQIGEHDISSSFEMSEGSYTGHEPALKAQRVVACATASDMAGVKPLAKLIILDETQSECSTTSRSDMLRAKITARQAHAAAEVLRAAAAQVEAKAEAARLKAEAEAQILQNLS